ncbi:response regulator transcription factor [Pleionea sediminis]|uniref:response regulator transcription factor n=1 Tax=Pleionea sediminis TaxID=2569479 RepID=UPI001184768B|nr:response regulator transcription factor [Pleionea sediminis]
MSTRLLIVEDDENLRETLADFLELEDFIVEQAATVAEAKPILESATIDLAVLDIMLPDGDGYELSQWIRNQSIETRILMLTARGLEKDVVEGFESGADDYVSKPYRSKELLMRIKALLRRPVAVVETNTIEINGRTVDWRSMTAKYNDDELHLTSRAFSILKLLLEHKNEVLSREAILDACWGKDVYVDNRTIDNFISNLKKQFDLTHDNSYYIKSVRGVGYCLMNERKNT